MPKLAVGLMLLIAVGIVVNGCRDASPPSPAQTVVDDMQLALLPIDVTSMSYLERILEHITVDPAGNLRYQATHNKGWGPNDIDPKHETTETREGRLSAQARAELARMFADSETWSGEQYVGPADSPIVTVHYGQKTASGGDLPKKMQALENRLRELARSMPIVTR
ncbi:MAG: hypothetical protein NTW19_21080 [Planctomycetota bacterium]|nr:hypothetical protein [Planctomycetota bacterium]